MENTIQNLPPVNFANQRVMTYAQVAQGLECSVDQLRSLYRDHKDEFQETVHFFNVSGEALRQLKKDMRNRHVDSPPSKKGAEKINSDSTRFALSFGKGAKCLKLWTCQGVARLSKLVDTPKAWELFNALENNYFKSAPPVAVEPKKKRKAPADMAYVYGFLMSNSTVKIGHTADITDRIKRMKREHGLDVLDEHHSPLLTRERARTVERTLHKKFAAVKVDGEFFDVTFDDIKDELDAVLIREEVIQETISEPVADPNLKLLVDLLQTPLDSPLKEKLFKETANLLLGKDIF